MCKRWDNSRGSWVKLQETSYKAFVGFSRELTEKLPPYLHHGKEERVVSVQLWPADCSSWPIQNWWWTGSLGIPESSKIERGKRGEFRDVLTSGREGRRKLNLEVAVGDETWTAAAPCEGGAPSATR
jgi:hypothetical protein